MLVKQLQFKGKVENSILCQPLLKEGLEKTASTDTKKNLTPEVTKFIETIKPDPSKGIYVLVNALGAGEYYSSNANADFFPEKALSHKGKDYGFETFLDAGAYAHHQNKDKARAFGDVTVSAWNPIMKRVDLVVYLDRGRCKQFGGLDVIDRIEAGEYPDVSMGSKVPFDVCSICGNKSKTRLDYCSDMKQRPNKILDDGRKVYVLNDYPRFFDISFVFIGADKTAKVMAKLASRNGMVCLGDYCTVPRLSAEVGEIFNSQNDYIQKEAQVIDCGCSCPGDCAEKAQSNFMNDILDHLNNNEYGETKNASQKKQADLIKEVKPITFNSVIDGLKTTPPDQLPKKYALTKTFDLVDKYLREKNHSLNH